MNYRNFAQWCLHKDELAPAARHTVEVLLQEAGTSDGIEAERILLQVTELKLYGKKISDLNPLQSFTQLTKLYLAVNEIVDVSALQNLTNLTCLSLGGNQISDLNPLKKLTNLTILDLSRNSITDLSSIASLTNLTSLRLIHSSIADLSSLENLINLTELQLSNNQITDLSSLQNLFNLTRLYLSNNQIRDLSPLQNLINLTILDLRSNQVKDLSPFSNSINLFTLNLSGNQIRDLSPLQNLINLTRLYLSNNQIRDLSPLQNLINLTGLSLSSNQICDLSPLQTLTRLESLDISNNPIIARLPSHLSQKWLRYLTEPIDRAKATEAIKQIYAIAGLDAPKIIFKSNPYECLSEAIAFICLPNLTENSSIQKKLVFQELLKLKEYPVINSIAKEFSLVDFAFVIEEQIFQQLLRESEEFLGNSNLDDVQGFLRRDIWNSHLDFGTLISRVFLLEEDYATKLNITLDRKTQEWLQCLKNLLESCGWMIPFEDVCLVCDRPITMSLDDQHRLHAEGKPALRYADGYKLYSYHGVTLPEKYGKLPFAQWQSQWLLEEDNAELRRILIQAIGYNRICEELNAIALDTWKEYSLLKIDADADIEPIVLLKMTCPSTGYVHVLRVPPDLESARQAIAWVNWGIDPEEFEIQT